MKKHLLHIASFKGNVGDIINHEGFYNKLRSQIDFDIEQIEIRKFYRNAGELNFDSELVKKIDDIYVSLEEMYDQYILKIKDILTK